MRKRAWSILLLMILSLSVVSAYAETTDHQHIWSEWTLDSSGTSHTAACEACGEAETVSCTRFTVTIAGKGHRVCPFCGHCGENTFAIVPDADATPVSAAPAEQRGELIVRGLVQPFEEDGTILYAFTMGYGQDGQLVTFKNVSEISVPIKGMELPANARMVRVSGAAGDDSTQTPEKWNDLAFTIEDDVLTFQNKTPSLYMVLAGNCGGD